MKVQHDVLRSLRSLLPRACAVRLFNCDLAANNHRRQPLMAGSVSLNNSYEWFIYLFAVRQWQQIFANEFQWSADLFKLVFVRSFVLLIHLPLICVTTVVAWQPEKTLQSSWCFPHIYTNWSNGWIREFNLIIVQWTRFSTNLLIPSKRTTCRVRFNSPSPSDNTALNSQLWMTICRWTNVANLN